MKTDPSNVGWERLRTGVLLIVGLTLTAAVVFFMDEALRELSEGPELLVAAEEARDLRPGAEVWVAGVPAGRVLSVRFRDHAAREGRVLVRAILRGDAADLLRADASALIRQSALLEPAVVVVRPGDGAVPFDFADTLRAEHRVGPRDVLARADTLMRRLETLQPLAERLRTRLAEGPGTVAALRRDSALATSLSAGATRLRRWSERAGDGTVALLHEDSSLAARWERIAARGDTIGRALPSGEIARLDAALTSLEDRVAALEASLSEPRGTVGRLMHDGALARERRTMEAHMDSLRAELAAEPLRWLRIRLF